MIQKTEGIVLRTIKFQETNILVTVYTREYGLISLIAKGYRSSRSRRRYSYLQALSIVEIVYYQRSNRDIQNLTESKTSLMLNEIQTHPIKLSLGLAIIEIFSDCVRETESDPDLFEFLKSVITTIDREEDKLVHVFLYFLVHLTRYLGFFPSDQVESVSAPIRLNIKDAILHNTQGKNDPCAALLRQFMICKPEDCRSLGFSKAEKKGLIKLLFDFYALHVNGFRYPQTLRVFSEVFS